MPRILLAIILLATLPAQAAIIHVSKSGNGIDGSDWENAFVEIGDAIEAATSGDRIWVASGTYNETVTFISGISLFGGFSGTELPSEFSKRNWRDHETIIDGNGLEESCVIMDEVIDTLFDGFTVTNGFLTTHIYGFAGGAGVRVVSSQIKICNCRIHNNVVATVGWIGTNSGWTFGGGLYTSRSVLHISNTAFTDNRADATGGAIWAFNYEVFPESRLTIANCLFDGNLGTAVYTTNTQVHLEYCTFGRGYRWYYNDLFYLETSPSSGPQGATVTNCIIRDNIRPLTNATYSNIRDFPGEGNIDVNPGFIDREAGNLYLRSDSPCIDSGTDVEVLNDLDGNPRPVDVKGRGMGQGFDMGCYEFQLKRSDLNQDGSIDSEDLWMFQEEWMREDGQ